MIVRSESILAMSPVAAAMRRAREDFRAESLLALLPPLIAVSWVITDAAMGFVAADRSVAATTVHVVGSEQTSIAIDTKQSRATVTICTPDGKLTAGIVQSGGSHAALQRLCEAGLRFTARIPKT